MDPQLVLDDLPHAGAFLHQDQRLLAELVEPDVAPRKRVAGRTDQNHLVLEGPLEANRPVAPGGADDAELEPSVGDEVDDGLGVVHLERPCKPWVPRVELAEEDRHDHRGGARRSADGQLAGECTGAFGCDIVEHLLLELEQALSRSIEAQPGLGRLHPAAGAVEQLRPQPLLSARTCSETAGWVTPSRSAAWEKLRRSTTAQKAASWRVSISKAYLRIRIWVVLRIGASVPRAAVNPVRDDRASASPRSRG